jgi:hypothetical protein
MKFLEKIRSLPEKERKIIFWAILIPLSILLFFLYGKYVQFKLKEIKSEKIGEELEIQKLKEKLEAIPKIENLIPKIK